MESSDEAVATPSQAPHFPSAAQADIVRASQKDKLCLGVLEAALFEVVHGLAGPALLQKHREGLRALACLIYYASSVGTLPVLFQFPASLQNGKPSTFELRALSCDQTATHARARRADSSTECRPWAADARGGVLRHPSSGQGKAGTFDSAALHPGVAARRAAHRAGKARAPRGRRASFRRTRRCARNAQRCVRWGLRRTRTRACRNGPR